MNITLGSDPELMLQSVSRNRIVSSLKVIGRDKHDPVRLSNGVAMYADNVLVEASMPPATSPAEATQTVAMAIDLMHKHLGPDYRLVAKASHRYDREELDSMKAWEVGCNPNFDAYAMKANISDGFQDETRTGSFHIHIGHPKLNTDQRRAKAVRVMDIFLGCSSVIYDKDPTAKARRSLYGRAGEFRPTPYGLEYRVLGNWPLNFHELVNLSFELAVYSADYSTTKDADKLLKAISPDLVKDAINNCNADKSLAIIKSAGIPGKFLDLVTCDKFKLE